MSGLLTKSPNSKMKRILSIVFFISLFATVSQGQTYKAYIKAAANAQQEKNYYAAYTFYQEALAFKPENIDLAFKAAENARMYNAFAVAENLYQQVVDKDDSDTYPTASFYLAEMLQKQGKYDDAVTQYDLYLSEQSGEDEFLTAKATKEKSASEYAIELVENPDLSVTLTRLDAVNTQFSEVGAIEKDGQLYYSSLRFPHPDPEDPRDPKYLAKVLVSEDGAAGVEQEEINNDRMITSHSAFSSKTNRFYYTLCDYTPTNDIKCDLYYRDIQGQDQFGPAVKLPDYINDETFTTTQPSIGLDNETNKEILYFVSDRPGGKGKFDIWYSIIDDNMNMTQPMNLDSVNTSDNDATPFFHIPSNTLYFSSQGYQGMGGYDVYRAEKINGHYGEVEHLEAPVNSSYDDLYYTLSNDMLSGHFSSNRASSTFIDDAIEACCFDIYHAKYEPVNLDLNALTCETVAGNERKLLGATVCLVDAKTGVLVDSITNYTDDSHQFELERNKEYLIIAKKDYYIPDTVTLSTKKIYKSQTFTKKLCLLNKTLELDVFTFDEVTREELRGATIVLEDLTDGTIQVITDYNPDGNDFHYTIKEGHVYKITASKPNYGTKTYEIDTKTAEIVEGRIRQDIYLSFGPMYLPLDLYFDNDKPDSRTTRRTTKTLYSESYGDYYPKKQEFIDNSPDPSRIDLFFEQDVKGGYDTLQIFLAGMKSALDKGKKLEITIQGYTSPRSTNAYNLFLGQRRVESVKNEISKYFGGALQGYLDSKQLIITDISYGETLAPKGISDSISEKKLSVYSYEASKERKVRIVQVNQFN